MIEKDASIHRPFVINTPIKRKNKAVLRSASGGKIEKHGAAANWLAAREAGTF